MSAARQLPFDVTVRASHAAAAALNAALIRHLSLAIIRRAVNTHRAKVQTWLVLALQTDILILDHQVGNVLIEKILERHQDIVDVDFG